MRTALADKLRQALKKIDRPGTFCVSGSVPAIMPGEAADDKPRLLAEHAHNLAPEPVFDQGGVGGAG